MTRPLLLLLLTATLMFSAVMAQPDWNACWRHTNTTCGECIAHGCFYCDTTGTGIGGVCAPADFDGCATRPNTLISSMSSLTQCKTKQPDVYENMATTIPIITGAIGLVIFLVAFKLVQPAYSPSTPVAQQQQEVLVMAPAEGQGHGHDQPLLAPTRWVLIKQQLTRDRVKHHCRRSGCCFKLLIVIVLVIVFALSIVAVAGGMWSIQVDIHNENNGWDWHSIQSAVAYDGTGVHTITRDPNDSNHKKLIFTWMPYTCDTVRDDSFTRCSIHRVIAKATQSVAIMALTCMTIVMILMIWSIIRCRSLNNKSVKFMALAAISHLVAVLMYAGGCYLLQSRVYTDSQLANTYMSPYYSPSYHLYLGLNWNVSVAAIVLNVLLLIPLTRAHIHAIPAPHDKQGCCKKRSEQQQQQQEEAPMGVTVAVPIAQPVVNPSVHNPYATGATSFMSPSYQYGSVQTTSAPSAPIQPSRQYPEI